MHKTAIAVCLLLVNSAFAQGSSEIEMLYQNEAFEVVVEKGFRAMEASPDDLMVCHLVGRALTELKRFEEAKPLLKKTSSKPAPPWMKSWSLGYVGVCHYATGQLKESKACFSKAIKMAATNNATKFAEKRLRLVQMAEYAKAWEALETEHIVFHIQPNHKIVDLNKYCADREAAFQENNAFFNAAPYKKIDFFVWSNADEGKKLLGTDIGFANPELCMIHSKTDQTKGHEITHILCDYGIKPNKRNRLINEGVAVAFDLTKRDRLEIARTAHKEPISLKSLMEEAVHLPESVVYPIGGALIAYLMEQKDHDSLKKLLKEQTYTVLLETYGIGTIEAFEQKFN